MSTGRCDDGAEQGMIRAGRSLLAALRKYGFPVSLAAEPALKDGGSLEARELHIAATAFADAFEAASLAPASPVQPAPGIAEGWRDMSTAPKDGTRVLVRAPGHLVMIAAFLPNRIHAAGPWWWSNNAPVVTDPDGWMPLPEPCALKPQGDR